MTRISLKDVAQKAGVHYSTVSLALANSPRIPASTRERLQALAEEMGYRPDAALSALNAYRKVRLNVKFQATLALVTDNTKWSEYHTGRRLRAGLIAQAKRLGYEVDEFYLGENGLTEARLAKILHSRNIRGVLLGGMRHPNTVLDLPWDRYACVAFGYSTQVAQLSPGLCGPLQQCLHEPAADARSRLPPHRMRDAGGNPRAVGRSDRVRLRRDAPEVSRHGADPVLHAGGL